MSSQHSPSGQDGELILQFWKRDAAPATLTLLRSDGSSSSTPIGPSDGFGPLHDLAHYVVERHLSLAEGFLGLIARGWTPSDFVLGAITPSGPDAVRAEGIAGLLALEALTDHRLPLGDFNDVVAGKCAEARPGYQPPDLTPTLLSVMRAELAALCRRWDALTPGHVLELSFAPPPTREG